MKATASNNELSGDANSFVIFEINNMMVKTEESSGVMSILDYIEMLSEERREVACAWYHGHVRVTTIVLCILTLQMYIYFFMHKEEDHVCMSVFTLNI